MLFPSSQFSRKPILRLGPAFSPECYALAFLVFAIARSNITCVRNWVSLDGFGLGILGKNGAELIDDVGLLAGEVFGF